MTEPPAEPRPPTEQRNPASYGLGQLDAEGVIALMNQEERVVLRALERAAPALAQVARQVSATFTSGGRIVFLGAGTSGRLAVQEAAELAPTFGVPPQSFVVLAAGGEATGLAAISRSEDDIEAAPRALQELNAGPGDAVIGIAASGRTPFVRAGLRAASRLGAWTCALANNPGSPIFDDADVPVLLDTGPEILTGSTRLKAGTAQKLALNRITTAAMVLAGRVVENHMADLVGSNAKLRERSVRIVMDIAHVGSLRATQLLEASEWSVRRALEGSG